MKPLTFLLPFLLEFFQPKNSTTVRQYQNEIEQVINDASSYDLPTDANMYRPTDSSSNIIEFGQYDFIIVGAGATGSVVVNRLSAIKKWKILVLEAGGYGNELTDLTSLNSYLAFTSYNWGHRSIPQTTACLGMINEQCPYPRGRGIGGTTLINGAIYSRGHFRDYNTWAEQGNPGWSFNDVLPLFRLSENLNHNDRRAPIDSIYHGRRGNLNVEFHLPRMSQVEAFVDAHKELGYKELDYNGKHEEGVSPSQLNIIKGRRDDGGKAFVLPIRKRPNLTILTGSFVTKVLLNNNTAYGVQFTYNNSYYMARASKEVILSAGSLSSPQILMLSGIGPKDHLEELNIPVIKDLPVGSYLRDHPGFGGLTFTSNAHQANESLTTYVEQFLKGYGPLTAQLQGVSFVQSTLEPIKSYPDLELIIFPYLNLPSNFDRALNYKPEVVEAVWGSYINGSRLGSFFIYIFIMHSRSHGTLRLRSSDPFEYPLIDSQFLSDENGEDLEIMRQGVEIAISLTKTKAFQKINATLVSGTAPDCRGHEYNSKPYWQCMIRQLTLNEYHPSSSCPMGPETSKEAVVDSTLRVHGIGRLRVADASVFPFPLTGHPNAPCVLIGEKLSEMLKSQYL